MEIRPYSEMMRKDARLSRAAFSRKYNIPVRTLEAWASWDREAPDYVIDLLGRVVYSDIMKGRAIFYVYIIGKHDEWLEGEYESYIEAIKEARHAVYKIIGDGKVEIRIGTPREDGALEDYDIVSF